MGLRYRKSIQIVPGVKLNLSKSGISTSIGRRGATLNFSKRGTRATVGIPGTGLSYQKTISGRRGRRRRVSQAELDESRAKVQNKYGFTDAEMRRFERKFRRNPKKYYRMSEAQLVRKIRRRGPRTPKDPVKRRQNFLIVILVILILIFLSMFSKK